MMASSLRGAIDRPGAEKVVGIEPFEKGAYRNTTLDIYDNPVEENVIAYIWITAVADLGDSWDLRRLD
jgi:hypothetical protein